MSHTYQGSNLWVDPEAVQVQHFQHQAVCPLLDSSCRHNHFEMDPEQTSIDYKPPFSVELAEQWSAALAQRSIPPSDQQARFARLLHAERFDPQTFVTKLLSYSPERWNELLGSARLQNYQPELRDLAWALWPGGKPVASVSAAAGTPNPVPVASMRGLTQTDLGHQEVVDLEHMYSVKAVPSDRAASMQHSLHRQRTSGDGPADIHPGYRTNTSTALRSDSQLRSQAGGADQGPGSSTPRQHNLHRDERDSSVLMRDVQHLSHHRAADQGPGTNTPQQLNNFSSGRPSSSIQRESLSQGLHRILEHGQAPANSHAQQGTHSAFRPTSDRGNLDSVGQGRVEERPGSDNTQLHSHHSGSRDPRSSSSSAMLHSRGDGMQRDSHEAAQRGSLDHGFQPPQHSLSSGHRISSLAPAHVSQHRSLSHIHQSSNPPGMLRGASMQNNSTHRVITHDGPLSTSRPQSGSYAQHPSLQHGTSSHSQGNNQHHRGRTHSFEQCEDGDGDEAEHAYVNNRHNTGGGELNRHAGGPHPDPVDAFAPGSEAHKLAVKLRTYLGKFNVSEYWHTAAFQLIQYQADEQGSVRDVVVQMVKKDNGARDLSLFSKLERKQISAGLLSECRVGRCGLVNPHKLLVIWPYLLSNHGLSLI